MFEIVIKEISVFIMWLLSNVHIIPIALFITWISAAGVRWVSK